MRLWAMAPESAVSPPLCEIGRGVHVAPERHELSPNGAGWWLGGTWRQIHVPVRADLDACQQ